MGTELLADDGQLLAALRAGDEGAFMAMVHAWGPAMLRLARAHVSTRAVAEEVVQEAWLRVSRADVAAVDNFAGWLTTIVARVCLNMLESRRSRREEPVGMAPPEPAGPRTDGAGPEDEALLADSVGAALLLVLDTLTPAERLAFEELGLPFVVKPLGVFLQFVAHDRVRSGELGRGGSLDDAGGSRPGRPRGPARPRRPCGPGAGPA